MLNPYEEIRAAPWSCDAVHMVSQCVYFDLYGKNSYLEKNWPGLEGWEEHRRRDAAEQSSKHQDPEVGAQLGQAGSLIEFLQIDIILMKSWHIKVRLIRSSLSHAIPVLANALLKIC